MLNRSIFRLPQVLPSALGSGSDIPRGTCLILLSAPCLYLAAGISPGVFFLCSTGIPPEVFFLFYHSVSILVSIHVFVSYFLIWSVPLSLFSFCLVLFIVDGPYVYDVSCRIFSFSGCRMTPWLCHAAHCRCSTMSENGEDVWCLIVDPCYSWS